MNELIRAICDLNWQFSRPAGRLFPAGKPEAGTRKKLVGGVRTREAELAVAGREATANLPRRRQPRPRPPRWILRIWPPQL